MNKIRIAHIIPTLNPGGAEKQIINIVNGLDDNLFESAVFVLKNHIKLADQIKKPVLIETAGMNSIKSGYKVWGLVRKMKKFSPALIHSHLYPANLVSRFVKPFIGGAKVINHVHGLSQWMKPPHILLERISLPLADAVITASRKSYEIRLHREKVSKDKLFLLYNSFPDNLFSQKLPDSAKKNPIIFGMASRLIKLKNIDAGIKTIRLLIDMGINAKMLIAGDGPDRNRLEGLVKRYALDKDITFIGFTNDMASFFNSIHIYMLTSKTEDMPLTIIEAMAAGKPVIAARVGGVPEILENLRFTMIVDDFESKDTILRISNFIDKLDLEKALKELSAHAFKKYSNRVYIKNLTRIYEKILNKTN